MAADSCCSSCYDSSLILDIGNVTHDMPFYLMRELPATEIGLLDAWKLLDIGKRITLRFGPCKDKEDGLSQRFYTHTEAVEVIKNYPIVFWVPQLFSNPFAARVKYMKVVRSIVVDLDDKVDPFFWTKTRDLFRAWGKGDLVGGIPCPNFFTSTGHGLHLYWILTKEDATDKLKDVAKILQRLIQLKISTYYEHPVDKIHIVQALRVPESNTKSGGRCRAFKIHNSQEMSILELANQCFSESEIDTMEKYLNDEHTFDVFTNILEPHAVRVGIKKKDSCSCSEPTIEDAQQPIPTPTHSLVEIKDEFNPTSIEEFSSIIDNEPSIRNKMFAKKCVYSLKVQAPIQEGFRDDRLFGLSVGLAKCGTRKKVLCRLVNMANVSFCYKPLSQKEVSNCTVRPYKYIYMTDPSLREQLGIQNWPMFSNYESTMTRKDAAKVASNVSHERAIVRLREAYSVYGFNIDVKKLCEYAEISRQTYYNFKKKGVLRDIFNWFINLSNYESIHNTHLVEQIIQMKQQINTANIESGSHEIDQFALAVQSKAMADCPT